MRVSITFMFVILASALVGQNKTTLKVLGKYQYVQEAESYGAIIILEENPKKCDPDIGFVSMEDQYIHLSESIKAKGSDAMLTPLEEYVFSEYRRKKFKLSEPQKDVFEAILISALGQNAIVEKKYYEMPEQKLANQDDKAILALRDAQRIAEILADHIGLKVDKILSIDDETRNSRNNDLHYSDPDRMALLLQLYEKLEQYSSSGESRKSSTSGTYSLWVAFELSGL